MLNRPPQGNTVILIPGPVGVLVWEPGNGSKYVMQTTFLGEDIARVLGGPVMVSLASMADNTFVAHAVNPGATGHWTQDYVRKKWQRIYGIGDHKPYLTMLLNWALGGPRAQAYAAELWQKAHGEDGKVVSLHARGVRRG